MQTRILPPSDFVLTLGVREWVQPSACSKAVQRCRQPTFSNDMLLCAAFAVCTQHSVRKAFARAELHQSEDATFGHGRHHAYEASRGFEPRSLDSGPRVLTVTPRGQLNFKFPSICTQQQNEADGLRELTTSYFAKLHVGGKTRASHAAMSGCS